MVKRSCQSLYIFGNVWRQAAPDLKQTGEGCIDEAVQLVTLVEELHAVGGSTGNYWKDLKLIGVEQKCLTFTHWKGCLQNHGLNRDKRWRDMRNALTVAPGVI